jgi:S-adenosylmethionine synthetase
MYASLSERFFMDNVFRFSTYTVESVSPGHPDKLCDQISDAILDAYLAQDPHSRVAVEVMGAHGTFYIAGEITSRGEVDPRKIARKIYRQAGYHDRVQVIVNLVQQSPDIAKGVNTGGAGDQGIMYGYATNETDVFMPKGVMLAHQLTRSLKDLREKAKVPWLKPDAKSQVTLVNGRVSTMLISTQHHQSVTQAEIQQTIKKLVMRPLLDSDTRVKLLVNPTGSFVEGGIHADTGLTGRKIMVDSYGGLIPHGGGAYSGKDATKVDRSGAYMVRFVAKSLVTQGMCNKCLVSVAYAIGQAKPVMVTAIDEQGRDLTKPALKQFDFRPQAIIERLGLRRPIFLPTATFGHYGKPGLPWEEVS